MNAIGNLAVDSTNATVHSQPLSLTAFELKVLDALAIAKGAIVHPDALHTALYGSPDKARDSNVVQVIIGRLRVKLDRARASASIRTHRGHGYTLEAAA